MGLGVLIVMMVTLLSRAVYGEFELSAELCADGYGSFENVSSRNTALKLKYNERCTSTTRCAAYATFILI